MELFQLENAFGRLPHGGNQRGTSYVGGEGEAGQRTGGQKRRKSLEGMYKTTANIIENKRAARECFYRAMQIERKQSKNGKTSIGGKEKRLKREI